MDSSETVQSRLEDLLQYRLQQPISVKRVRNLTRISYVSAIAHPLAIQAQLPVAIVVNELVPMLRKRLQQSDFSLGLPISLEVQSTLTVQAIHSELIEIEFSDHSIALWLKDLLTSKLTPQFLVLAPIQSAAVFTAQYNHTRCCSLLRLAHTEKLIMLHNLEGEPCDWTINWTIKEQWSWDQSARHLLGKLFSLWEALSQSIERPDLLLIMSNQSFQQFHREVQLFGEESEETDWLLLLAFQRVIYRLLEKLQVPIPTVL